MSFLTKIIVLFFLVCLLAQAAMEGKTVEIRGKVINFNSQYVYLKWGKKKTIAPRKYVTKAQLKSKKMIYVFVPTKDYLAMVKNLKKKK